MVSALNDSARAKHLSKVLHEFLSTDLQLPLRSFESKDSGVEAFGALLGVMRASNPLFLQPRALAGLKVPCPLTRRFPTTFTGKLTHYEDAHVALEEVIDHGGGGMHVDKMWRLLVWIFLGNGGHQHQAWKDLRKMDPVLKRYRPDARQPLEVLRWVVNAVSHTGKLMLVIGSDGLDKKSRLAERRILWLTHWHKEVPGLVESFNCSPDAFVAHLSKIKGLSGELTQKEILILLSASRDPYQRSVGQAMLTFGQGAKNGAKAFLDVPLIPGKSAGIRYGQILRRKVPELEATIGRLFPELPRELRAVTVSDIEPCLCGAFIYSKMVEKLRKSLPAGSLKGCAPASAWAAVCSLSVPAGFIPHDEHGRPERRTGQVLCPSVPYAQVRLESVPAERKLSRKSLFKMWGTGTAYKEPPRKKIRTNPP